MNSILPSFRKLESAPRTEKGWGFEQLIVNQDYTGKILAFKTGGKLSMHFHDKKNETFLVTSGRFIFRYIEGQDASLKEVILLSGDIIDIPRLLPHQLEAIEEGAIIEFSTTDYKEDSFRIVKGDSQQIK